MDRRNVLSVLGGVPIVAATLSMPVGCVQTDYGTIAAAPWSQTATGDGDARRRALAFAILAPNPHNMQPWIVRLVGADAIELFIDDTRLLPATDPFGRQILLGCGAFLELLTLAAAQDGYRLEITLWPNGAPTLNLDGRQFARVTFVADQSVKSDPLFRQILLRRTNREPQDTSRIVSEGDRRAISASVQTDGFVVKWAAQSTTTEWRDLIWRAMKIEIETPVRFQESIDVMRFGARQASQKPWGIVLDFPGVTTLNALGLVNARTLADPKSIAFKQGLDTFAKSTAAVSSFVWLQSEDNSRQTQILAGRAYARMNLTATKLGLAMQPWSQSLQEYSEMNALFQEALTMTGSTALKPLQMLAGVGYAPAVPAAPRRPLKDLIPE